MSRLRVLLLKSSSASTPSSSATSSSSCAADEYLDVFQRSNIECDTVATLNFQYKNLKEFYQRCLQHLHSVATATATASSSPTSESVRNSVGALGGFIASSIRGVESIGVAITAIEQEVVKCAAASCTACPQRNELLATSATNLHELCAACQFALVLKCISALPIFVIGDGSKRAVQRLNELKALCKVNAAFTAKTFDGVTDGQSLAHRVIQYFQADFVADAKSRRTAPAPVAIVTCDERRDELFSVLDNAKLEYEEWRMYEQKPRFHVAHDVLQHPFSSSALEGRPWLCLFAPSAIKCIVNGAPRRNELNAAAAISAAAAAAASATCVTDGHVNQLCPCVCEENDEKSCQCACRIDVSKYRWAAIGKTTAAAISSAGIVCDAVAAAPNAASLCAAIQQAAASSPATNQPRDS